MIRINLLPIKNKRKQRTAVVQLAAFAAAIGIAVLLAIVAIWYFGSEVSEREAQLDANKVAIKRLEDDVGQVQKAEDQRKQLKQQIAVIDELKLGNKLGPVRVLDALSNNIPKRVWLDSIVEKSGSVTLQGTGLENADVSEFMRQLQKNRFFRDVSLDLTKASSESGVEIFRFTILATVSYGT